MRKSMAIRAVPSVVLGAIVLALYAVIPHPRPLIAGRFVLTESDVPGFTRIMSGEIDACLQWGTPTIKFEIECQETAVSSFVTNNAFVAGATWEDALEASSSAPFVAIHHGAFEVNDLVEVFSTSEVAHTYYEDFAYTSLSENGDPNFSWQRLPAPIFGEESVTTRFVQGGPYDVVPEPQLVTIWRRGRVVTTLNASGSADQDPSFLLRLAALIDQRIQQQGR